jgi:putative membrane-bound dehydrogenase-like protein
MKNFLITTMKHFLICLLAAGSIHAAPVPLFDGKTLDGWEIPEAESKWWKVMDEKIVGGSMDENVPKNTFLATTKSYGNFEMRFKVKLTHKEGFANSGIQVRSTRKGGEMSGYQVDAGSGYWGTIWDEHRRDKVIASPVDQAALTPAVKDWEWNEYRILCEGPRIRTWINGVFAIDYTELDPAIPLEGHIGLQAHSGGKFLVEFKDITIEELAAPGDPLSPEAEKASFVVPEGFEVELVTSEEQGVPKPITVSWDASGKMWTMTAVEYPMDANENLPQAQVVYARGGNDKALFFDNPSAPGPHKPRVFAEGLVIPLGILPTKNGALVQYGTEIRHYIDDNKDGKADRFETILEGFGIQDSHLFPHQFENAPGGWIYVAQGLFNSSKVRRPGGKPFACGATEIAFDSCKLARFRPDGSEFELLASGPNNIWGLETDRDGEVFLQEANDLGIPVAEFLPGTHYWYDQLKFRPYAPQIPASLQGSQMGGSGLSGLAIASDRNSAFAAKYAGHRTFYIANPITNRVQVITMTQDAQGRPTYTKQEDFMTAGDTSFRPIAVRFGPDGNLYVVDWYNKIISHNEVPRTHPERDKTRGRIWRIKPKGSPTPPVPDLVAADTSALIAALDHPSALVSRLAWIEIGKRGDKSMVPALAAIISDPSSNLPRRLNAFWAIEELRALDSTLLSKWAADPSRHMRYEVIRAAGDLKSLDPTVFLKLIQPGETDFRVRTAAANGIRLHSAVTPEMLAALAPFVAAQSHGTTGREIYENDFLRYQIRWAFETHPVAVRALLAKEDFPAEARALAHLSLPADEAALEIVKMLPTRDRSPNADEISLLGGKLNQPAVSAAFSQMLASDKTRTGTLRILLTFDASAASDVNLRRAVTDAAAALDSSEHELILALARKFRVSELIPTLLKLSETGAISRTALLKTLNEIGDTEPARFEPFLADADPETRREAVIGYTYAAGAAGVDKLAEIWPTFPGVLRELATNGMLRTKESAEAFVLAMAAGKFNGASTSATDRAISQLGVEHPAVRKLLEVSQTLLMPVVALEGGAAGQVNINIDLKGPFTVESWVKFDAPPDSADSLLGKEGSADFNFYSAIPRIHAYGSDLIAASRPIVPGIWTHIAYTRDAAGEIRLYLDGEPDATSTGKFTGDLLGLKPGVAIASGGTAGRFTSYRVWDRARTAAEIQEARRTRFEQTETAEGLLHNLPGNSGPNVVMTLDFPELRTPAEAAALLKTFELTKAKAEKPGDAANGRKLAETSCYICHQVKGEGMAIGPDLSGAGAMGIDGLLRNILQPNEQLESGYYRHDITLKDGTLASGFLSSEDQTRIVLRQIGTDDRVIPREQIDSHTISKRSLMPEGLIAGYTDQQVADLFAYLLSLK